MDTKNKTMTKSKIKDIAIYLPERIVFNDEIESKIKIGSNSIPFGSLEKIFGITSRRFAEKHVQVSDLAVSAALQILEKTNTKIDFLIFAAASSDLIEPATANIIQQKLKLNCPCLDIKNACNSMLSAIQVASAMIDSNLYKNILIVNGEKLSEVINYNPRDENHLMECLPGYTLGDAGAAILISHDEGAEIVHQSFSSLGQYWNLCKVEGGGSMAFRNPQSYYFEGQGESLKNAFFQNLPQFIENALAGTNWTKEEIDVVINHQVSDNTCKYLNEHLRISEDKYFNTFKHIGNVAAATAIISLKLALNEQKVTTGKKVMLIGMAAGISMSAQFIQW